MKEGYRVDHRGPDGRVAELMVTTCRASAVATAASWANWLGRKDVVGEVAAIDRRTGEAIRVFPVEPPLPDPVFGELQLAR